MIDLPCAIDTCRHTDDSLIRFAEHIGATLGPWQQWTLIHNGGTGPQSPVAPGKARTHRNPPSKAHRRPSEATGWVKHATQDQGPTR